MIEPQDEILDVAVAVGHAKLCYRRAVGDHGDHHPVGIAQRVPIHRNAIGRDAEPILFDTKHIHGAQRG